MRYFIIFYTGKQRISHEHAITNGIYAIESITYPAIYETTRHIERDNLLENAIINNIIELSKEDYNSFRQ